MRIRMHEHLPAAETNRQAITGMYQECGWYARVLILADHSDANFERYTLQVLETLPFLKSESLLRVGTRFLFARRRGLLCYGMPQLVIDEE